MDQVWKPEYEIGHPEIDQDHRSLIQVLGVMSLGYCDRDLMDSQIKILERYVMDHFSREERLMHQVGYPHLEDHKALHSQFRDSVAQMRRQWADQDYPELQAKITEALSRWLVDHILGADHAYAPWLSKP
jgi:hemerythrin-like metal-binding protein